MDSSEIGRYGTISFMKRLEPNTIVAAFPIDEEEVTFGRDPKCSVRLYYNTVSPVHCKIIFEDRKAFVRVLGANGLIVDGCKVFSSPSSSKPTTIPLTNNSDIEIHNKRFRFTYPPKELRAALLATPSDSSSTSNRRALRMSMIQSAQVFSPRPSKDPRENLRVLQSPIKPFRVVGHEYDGNDADEEGQDDEIVLVDGNHPRVVEEEKDLIIFEDIKVVDRQKTLNQPAYSTPDRRVAFTVPFNASPSTPSPSPPTPQDQFLSLQSQSQPQTPIRRFPRPSLHRAVLIRSAQRAVMQAEMEKEDEEEEKEVEEFIVTDDAVVDRISDEREGLDEDDDSMDEAGGNPAAEEVTSSWRKKIDVVKIWPFTSGSSPQFKDGDEEEEDITDAPADDLNDQYDDQQDVIRHDAPIASTSGAHQVRRVYAFTPPPANVRLGKFMTPQVSRVEGKGQGRKSYAGPAFDHAGESGGAMRVAVEQPWRVKDIVLPERDVYGIKQEDGGEKRDVLGGKGVSRGGRMREQLTEEERKVIQERRRSALTTPDIFFGGQAPGTRNLSAFPGSPVRGTGSPSPTKQGVSSFGQTDSEVNDDDDDEIDTRSLLEKMKETVEGMKRRRSMNPRLNMSERRMSLGLGMSPKNRLATGDGKEEFSLLAPGVKEELLLELQEEDQEEDTMQAREDRGKEIDVEVYKENATEGNLLEGGGNYTNDDIEGAPTEPPVTPIRAPTVHPYETPRMDGLRNMFMAPRITSTPSYSGVRDMFVHGGVKTRQTPTFEGIGEMMRTPERYHYTPNDEVQEDLDEGEDTGAEWMLAEKSNRVKTTPASPHPLVPTIRTVAVEGVVEDEPREQEDTVVKRRGRSSSKQVTSDDGGAVQKPKARLLRGKKAVEEVTEQESVIRTKTTRTRKGKAQDSEELSEQTPSQLAGGEVTPVPPRASRRAREATDGSNTLDSKESLPRSEPPSKPARKTRTVRSRSLNPEGSESDVSAPAKATTTRRFRVKEKAMDRGDKTVTETSGIQTKPIDIDVDDDSPNSVASPELEVCQANGVPVARVRRGARSRIATVEAIKEEPADMEPKMLDEKMRTGKGKKTPAKSSGSATRSSARTKKDNGSSPTPVSGTSAASEDGFDKENAPDTVEDDEQAPEKVVKIRVTRSKKTYAAKVKEEQVTEVEGGVVEPPARTRAGSRARK